MTQTGTTVAILEGTTDAVTGVTTAMLASVRTITQDADLTAGIGWVAVARMIMAMDDLLGADLSPDRKDALAQIAQAVEAELGHCREER